MMDKAEAERLVELKMGVGLARSGVTREGSVEEKPELVLNKKWEDGMVGIGGAGLNLFLDGWYLRSEASGGPKTPG